MTTNDDKIKNIEPSEVIDKTQPKPEYSHLKKENPKKDT